MLQIIYKNYKESLIKFSNSKYGYLNEIFKKILTIKRIYFLKLSYNDLKKFLTVFRYVSIIVKSMYGKNIVLHF